MTNKQNYSATRIAALEQLIVVLRKQADGMRRSLKFKDEEIQHLKRLLKATEACADNSIAIYR